MRESEIEKYLHDRVRTLGGEHRRVKWIGRSNAPDDFIGIPHHPVLWDRPPFNAFIECKRPGKQATAAQAREHDRMRSWGVLVYTVSTTLEIDAILPLLSKGK